MSVPPELMALLQGGGADPGADPSAAGADPYAGAQDPTDPSQDPANVPPQDGAPSGDSADYADQTIDMLKKWLDTEQEPEDQALISKILADLMKLKAKDQAETDGAMSGKVTPRVMRKVGSGNAA